MIATLHRNASHALHDQMKRTRNDKRVRYDQRETDERGLLLLSSSAVDV